MTKMRSLKIVIPPKDELAQARDQILTNVRGFLPTRDKISFEPKDGESVVDEITKRLREHKKPRQSGVRVYNQVVFACASVAAAAPSAKPIVVEEIAKELVRAACALHRVLAKRDLLPNYVYRVFRTTDAWNQFIEHLEALTTLKYSKPPRNTDPLKRACAVEAYLLITNCTSKRPTSTKGGLFRSVAGLLHQFVCPTKDEKRLDLKSACDDVCKRVKAGGNLENERW